MRCKYCSGEISLETAFCPYCGKPNEHARQHAQELRRFRRSYEETRSGVQRTVRRYTGLSIRIVTLALLLLATVLLLIAGGQSYSIRRSIVQSRTEKNALEVMAVMDRLLDAGDYFAFTAYCEEHYVESYDSVFESYTPVIRASRTYCYTYNDLMRTIRPPEYTDLDFLLECLSDDLENFYSALNMEDYQYYEGADSPRNRELLADMEHRLSLLLQTYCHLSPEDTENFPTMSKARRALLLEEAILHAE